ncbi:putative phytol kinase 3, chloroplastic [Auxenochlorella protothecoides]|uniref:phytol kinase n=2 Tax=Auxenochlorella protothecoides TaxID=3075 RepID=A0A087SPN8_AUXPR|nr:putative phytol kinase 3, chloroplastic [Auxenochlorella protothecoides]KFM27692.1 putative phytol kinase 3, chloroplastic [Auxenochlorella protothecoides]
MNRDLLAWLCTAFLAVGYLHLCRLIGSRGGLPRYLTRKIIHIGTGPIFMLCWPMYSESHWSSVLCSSVPALATLQFLAVGSGWISDPKLVATSSVWCTDPNVPNPVQRTGLRQELLTGPVLYGLAHVAAAALGWRRSPTAVVALCALCGGDGAAELGGHWLPRVALPWNRQKTLGGSISAAGGAFLLSSAMLSFFGGLGFLYRPSPKLLLGAALAAAGVESLPLGAWDNAALPLAIWVYGVAAGWQ